MGIKKNQLKPYFPIILVIIAGLFITIFTVLIVYEKEHENLKLLFETEAKKRIQNIEDKFNEEFNYLKSIVSFYNASNFVDKDEFKKFNEIFISKKEVLNLIWAPLVKNEERQAFEVKAQNHYANFGIKELDEQNNAVKATIRSQYFPVLYITPESNIIKRGMDLFESHIYDDEISDAIESNKIVPGEALEIGTQESIIAFAPIYKNNTKIETSDQRKANILGIIAGFFDIAEMLSHALHLTDKNAMNITILSIDDPDGKTLIHKYQPDLQIKNKGKYYFNVLHSNRSFELAQIVNIGERKWKIKVTPSEGYFQDKISFQQIAIIVIGLLITLLIAGYLFILSWRQNTIEKIVKERTLQLKQNEKKLKEANFAKSAFLSSMSHEIRTPMNGILGIIDLLAASKLDDDQREKVEVVAKSGDHLLEIINEILDYSKIEAGEMKIEPSACNLNKSIQDVINLLAPKAKSEGLYLSFNYKKGTPKYLMCDSRHICQVVFNLIGNAIKFTEAGQINVTVEAKQKDNKNVTLYFAVTDTGIGIPEEKYETVFNKFTQDKTYVAHKTKGTGLGLSICKSLVELMEGEIGLESKVEKGSTFWFELELPIISKEEIIKLPEKNTCIDGELCFDANVLVVDDMEANQYVTQAMLESLGCTVDVVSNGLEAVSSAEENKHDIIFMDCQMPVMDGYKATQKIRAAEKGEQHVIIVAITANVMQGAKGKCLSAGMDDYITKPLKTLGLSDVMKKWDIPTKTNKPSLNNDRANHKEYVADNVIDTKILNEIRDVMQDRFEKMIIATINDMGSLVKEIDKSLLSKSIKSITKAAHSFKSVSEQVGAVNLANLALRLSQAGDSAEFKDIEIMVKKLKTEHKKAEKHLKSIT